MNWMHWFHRIWIWTLILLCCQQLKIYVSFNSPGMSTCPSSLHISDWATCSGHHLAVHFCLWIPERLERRQNTPICWWHTAILGDTNSSLSCLVSTTTTFHLRKDYPNYLSYIGCIEPSKSYFSRTTGRAQIVLDTENSQKISICFGDAPF